MATQDTITRKTYSAGGHAIATPACYAAVSGNPEGGNNGLFYNWHTCHHSDHLGSATFLTHGNGHASEGNKVANSTKFFTPFGEYRIQPSYPTSEITDSPLQTAFTGHKHNDYIKMIYMGARWYLPNTNRWLSPDSIIPDPTNPQSYNRYSYGYNNPVKYFDPDGHAPSDGCEYEGCSSDPNTWRSNYLDYMVSAAEESGQSGLIVIEVPVESNSPGDPRGAELVPVACSSFGCMALPSLVPTYVASPGAISGAPRSPGWQKVGDLLDIGGAALDLGATAISGSFTLAQVGSLALGGPGPDDAIIALAYYEADTSFENPISWLGAGLVTLGDFASGESDYSSNNGLIIGQDTSVLLGTAAVGQLAGQVPFAGPALDTTVNLAVNAYDIGRISGRIPTMMEVRFDSNGFYVLLYE